MKYSECDCVIKTIKATSRWTPIENLVLKVK